MFQTKQTLNSNHNEGISMVIYGEPGTGKTTVLGSLPEGQTLFIDADGGLSTLAKKKHTYISMPLPDTAGDGQEYKFLDKLDEIYNSLRFETHPYLNIVIDSASEFEKYLQLALQNVRGKQFMSLKEYGDAAQLTAKYLKQFRDLKYPDNTKVRKPINIFFSALQFPLEILKSSDITITKMYPMLTKKLAPTICGIVDIVARMEILEDGKRGLRIIPLPDVTAKCRFANIFQENISQINGHIDLVTQVLEPIRKGDTLAPAKTKTKTEPKTKPGKL